MQCSTARNVVNAVAILYDTVSVADINLIQWWALVSNS